GSSANPRRGSGRPDRRRRSCTRSPRRRSAHSEPGARPRPPAEYSLFEPFDLRLGLIAAALCVLGVRAGLIRARAELRSLLLGAFRVALGLACRGVQLPLFGSKLVDAFAR